MSNSSSPVHTFPFGTESYRNTFHWFLRSFWRNRVAFGFAGSCRKSAGWTPASHRLGTGTTFLWNCMRILRLCRFGVCWRASFLVWPPRCCCPLWPTPSEKCAWLHALPKAKILTATFSSLSYLPTPSTWPSKFPYASRSTPPTSLPPSP